MLFDLGNGKMTVASIYTIAKKAAVYKWIVDYHSLYKPTGIQRTYPNVINFEGVKNLENFKWADEDQPQYTTSFPCILMIAGPMDYTPRAMRNATHADFRPINDNPIANGTRCNNLPSTFFLNAYSTAFMQSRHL